MAPRTQADGRGQDHPSGHRATTIRQGQGCFAFSRRLKTPLTPIKGNIQHHKGFVKDPKREDWERHEVLASRGASRGADLVTPTPWTSPRPPAIL